MPRSGPRRVLSGLQVQAVAAALDIHPFMLSKWRKDARDGTLRGRLPKATSPLLHS